MPRRAVNLGLGRSKSASKSSGAPVAGFPLPRRAGVVPVEAMKRLLFFLSALVILVILASLVKWGDLARAFATADFFPLLVAVLLTFLFPVLNTLRWQAVLRALGIHLSHGEAFRITMACWPAGTLTPGKVGDLLKAAPIPDRRRAVGSVVAERVVDVGVLGAFGLVFGALIGQWWAAAAGAAGFGAAIVAAAGARLLASLLEGHGVGKKLEGLLVVERRLLAQPRLLLGCLLASALNWFLSMAQLVFLLQAFGSGAPWLLIVGILPAATFVGLIPVTIAGAGTRDAALLLLAAGAVDPAALLASSIVYTFLGYFLLGVLGLPFLGALGQPAAQPDAK